MNIKELTHDSFSYSYNQLEDHEYVKWNASSFTQGFPYEYYYYQKKNLYRPWEDFSVIREQLTDAWNETVVHLEVLFSNRDKNEMKPYMQKGIVMYLCFLYWSNQLPVNLSDFPTCLRDLKGKSVNLEERLSFILARPYFYPSFMQLKSLMEEQIKIAAKMAALNKYNK